MPAANKAALLSGLTVFGGGVCDAIAATTQPQIDTFTLVASGGTNSGLTTQNLSFQQFDPALGTLTGVNFSLNSNLSVQDGATASISVNSVPLSSQSTSGGYNFTNLSGLKSPLTTAFYTGTSTFNAALSLNTFFCFHTATWTGNGAFTGLSLTYDYTPTAVPLPGALPLFASGVAGIALTAWRSRRKRKAKASLM
jgi:hypothetical protein